MALVDDSPVADADKPDADGLAAQGDGSTVSPGDTFAEATPRPSWIGIWALACALLGLVGLLPVIGSVLGIALGRVAIRRSSTGPVRGGRGLAVTAFAVGVVTLALIVLLVAAYALIVVFGSA